ncbi:MAG: class I SAM-dependent methyltransferase [Chitinophagaceae bacterium]
MASFKCILCDSTDVVVTETINTDDLAKVYMERSKINVSRFFPEPTIYLCTCNVCGLKFYAPQAIGDGKFYDELQSYNAYYMDEKAEFSEASRWIAETDDVLEVGGGSGSFTNFIRYGSYTGLEFSETAIRKASENGLNVICQDIHQHALLHPQQYDVVCYFQVLEHVANPKQFIKDSVDCLKTGGKLILAVPNEDSFINKAANFYLNMPPHHASRYTNKVFKKIAEFNHLSLCHLFHEPLNKNHRLFYAKTKIYDKLNVFTKVKPKSIDLSPVSKLLYTVAFFSAYVFAPFITKKERATGQSVLAVYQKH